MTTSTLRLTTFSPVLVALAIFTTALYAAQPASAEADPQHTIDFESTASWSVVTVRVGDSRPLRCILDTGMPNGLFIFDPALGAELDLNYAATVPVKGAGKGVATANIAPGETLHLDDLEFTNQNIIVLTEAGELADMGIDAVIGATVFSQFMVEMDFRNLQLNLFDPNTIDTARFGDELPMEVIATKPHIQGKVSIDDGPPIPVSLMVDTGANLILSLYPPSLASLHEPSKSVPTIVASGVGGSVRGVVGRVSTLQLGTHRFTNAVAGFSDNPIGTENGVIGMGILRRFIVTFDYTNNRMFLRPARAFKRPFEFGMSGINLRPHTDGGAVVMHVIDGSPAAKHGILTDDLIVAIDGKKLDASDGSFILSKMRQHGRKITLTIDRDGAIREITFKLQRMI